MSALRQWGPFANSRPKIMHFGVFQSSFGAPLPPPPFCYRSVSATMLPTQFWSLRHRRSSVSEACKPSSHFGFLISVNQGVFVGVRMGHLRYDFFVGHIKWLLIFEWHLVRAKYTKVTLKSTDLNLDIPHFIYFYILFIYFCIYPMYIYIYTPYYI